MNQMIKHSQTPEFGKNKSCTTAILRKHPKPEEMRAKRFSTLRANVRDFTIFAVMSLTFWSLITLLITAVFGGDQ